MFQGVNYDALYPDTVTDPLVVPDAVPVIDPAALPLIVVPDNAAVAGAVPTELDPQVVIAGIVPDAVPVTVPVIAALLKFPATVAPVNEPDVVAAFTVLTTPLCVA